MTGQLGRLLTDDAVAIGASDIHIEPMSGSSRVRLRIDGLLHDVAEIDPVAATRLVRFFRVQAGHDPDVLKVPEEGHVALEGAEGVRMRLNCTPTTSGPGLVLRLLEHYAHPFSLDTLGMTPEQLDRTRDWLNDISGMFIVAGPTGSGKTATLYALLHELKNRGRSLVSIEDPVEFEIDGVTQIEINTRRGLDVAEALRSVFRLDPDFLAVGEVRDHATAEAAIDAGTAGRVLMTTIHAKDAAGAVTSLRMHGASDLQLTATLELVIAQRLVRRLCSECRKRSKCTAAEVQWLQRLGRKAPAETWHAEGCDACGGRGVRGRVGVFELWRLGGRSHELLQAGSSENELRAALRESGRGSLLDDGLAKADAGLTSISELMEAGGLASAESGGLDSF